MLLLKASCSSTMVEHLSHQPEVQSLKPVAATSTGRGEWCNKACSCRTVVEHLPHQTKVQGLNPTAAASTVKKLHLKAQNSSSTVEE
jgi:hypothetical protein